MANTDIFKSVEVPHTLVKRTEKLVEYADALMYQARTKKQRRAMGMNEEEELIEASRGRHVYPVLTWSRRIKRAETSLSLVDKRSARLGFMLTVHAGVEIPEMEVVKVFILNNELGYRGLKRIVNGVEPEDVVGSYLDGLHRSTVRQPLRGSVSEEQSQDYIRAIATAYLPKTGL